MNNNIFREKSIERISSPEDLGGYLRVTKPSIFIIMFAILIALASLFIWSYFMSITSFTNGVATVENGVMTATYEDSQTSKYINDSMYVEVGSLRIPIDQLTMDYRGRIVTISTVDIPNGDYDVRVGYRQTRIIDLLIN